MPQLLLMANNPAADGFTGNELAGRFKIFDLVDWHPDGWAWGEQELKNPRFRILQWVNATAGECQQLLGPTIPHIDSVMKIPTEYDQPRAFFLNLTDPRIAVERPEALAWWADDTRAQPIYVIPDSETLRIADLVTPHAAIPV